MSRSETIESLAKGIDVIKILSENFAPQSRRSIFLRLNRNGRARHVSPTALLRILNTMKEAEFVEQVDGGLWRLAPGLTKISDSLRQYLRDEAERLRELHARHFLDVFSDAPESAPTLQGEPSGRTHPQGGNHDD